MTNREKIMAAVIAVLSLVILCGGAYFASEVKYCSKEEENEVEFDKIGFTEFTTLLNGDSPEIIYIARPGCYYCQQQEPIAKEIVGKYNLVFHYLNTDEVSQEDMNKLFALDVKLFGENGKDFGTPTTLVVQKGKIVDAQVGLTQKADFVNFLTKNGFID